MCEGAKSWGGTRKALNWRWQGWEARRGKVRGGREPAGPPPGTILTDECTQLMGQLSGTGGQDLPPHILEDDRPGLQVHHEHGHELRLGPLQLHLWGQAAQSPGLTPHHPATAHVAQAAERLTDVS